MAKPKRVALTQERLCETYIYNSSGCMDNITIHQSNRSSNRKRKPNNYAIKTIDGFRYQEHRLVWMFFHGVFPPDAIDHINGIKADNHIDNLRPATGAQNNCNIAAQPRNKLGLKNISLTGNKEFPYRVRVQIHGVEYSERCRTIDEAKEAQERLAKKYHGEFKFNG